jgi:integrase
MKDSGPLSSPSTGNSRSPWNKGKIIGPRPPLRPRHVWSIRARLHLELRARDLALFNLAIDSKLRGCDLVALRVDDVAPRGYTMDRANVRQRKNGRPVRFELTEQTRQSLDAYLRSSGRVGAGSVSGPRRPRSSMTTRQYARLVERWVAGVGLDPRKFATHSMRRTKDPDLPPHGELAGGPAVTRSHARWRRGQRLRVVVELEPRRRDRAPPIPAESPISGIR